MKVFEDLNRVKITMDDTADIEERIKTLEDYDLVLTNYPDFLKDVSSILSTLNDLVKTRLASFSEKDKILTKITDSSVFEKYKKNIEDTIVYRIYQKLDDKNEDLLYLVTYLYFSSKLYNLQYEKSKELFITVKNKELELLQLKDDYTTQGKNFKLLQAEIDNFKKTEDNKEKLESSLKSKEEEILKLKNKILMLESEKSDIKETEQISEEKIKEIISKELYKKDRTQSAIKTLNGEETKIKEKSPEFSVEAFEIEAFKQISENPRIHKKKLAKILNIDLLTLEEVMKNLKEKQKIKRVGFNWVILDEKNDTENSQ